MRLVFKAQMLPKIWIFRDSESNVAQVPTSDLWRHQNKKSDDLKFLFLREIDCFVLWNKVGLTQLLILNQLDNVWNRFTKDYANFNIDNFFLQMRLPLLKSMFIFLGSCDSLHEPALSVGIFLNKNTANLAISRNIRS